MKEVVTRILAAEQAAQQVVAQARSKATDIAKACDEKVAAIISDAESQARLLIQMEITSAHQEAEALCAKSLEEATAARNDFLVRKKQDIEALTREIVTRITTTDYSARFQDE